MIDILILSYNQEKFTKEVIKRFKNRKEISNIIICDNNSSNEYTIKSEGNINSHYYKLKYNDKIDKRAYARNTLIEKSESEWLWFMDGDCIPETYHLDVILQFMKKYPDSILMGKKNWIDLKDLNNDSLIMHDFINKLNIKFEQLDSWEHFFSFSFFVNRRNILKFDEDFKGWGMEDSELAYRLQKNGIKIYHTLFFQPNHIIHPIYSTISKEHKEIILNNIEIMLKKYNYSEEMKSFARKVKKTCLI